MGMHALETSHEEGENHAGTVSGWLAKGPRPPGRCPSCLCAPRASAAERQPQRQRPARCPAVERVLAGIGKQECEGNKPAGGARCPPKCAACHSKPCARGRSSRSTMARDP